VSEVTATDLMARYCDGDADAFQALYDLVSPRLLGYLIGLVGERPTAEDLLQQTFLKLHEARDGYVRGADPLPWMFTIAHRTFLDEARRSKRTRARFVQDEQKAASVPAPPTSDGEEQGFSQVTLAALATLPHNQREALILLKIHGHSVNEAAAITGTSAGAVKIRAHRAYVALRKMLQRPMHE
jgi:RNA polymerase sigma-70 factor, ECF subfamily